MRASKKESLKERVGEGSLKKLEAEVSIRYGIHDAERHTKAEKPTALLQVKAKVWKR